MLTDLLTYVSRKYPELVEVVTGWPEFTERQKGLIIGIAGGSQGYAALGS